MSATAAGKVWAGICRERLRVLSSDLTVATWADRYRVLSSESAAIYGKWSTLPFQRGPFDAVSDRKVYRVVIKSATQMLKTETILNGIGYFAHMDPGPILVLQPRDADAKAFSKERISPMIRDTPALRAIFSPSKSRSADNTIEEKFFVGGMLAITSAGSPANLSRRAIRFLFCDEIDKYPISAGPEGNPISLARKRTATFRHMRKEILTCSPTGEGSEIDRAYEASDKREYFIPCPACGHWQSLMLRFRTQVRWDSTLPSREEQAKSARYHCELRRPGTTPPGGRPSSLEWRAQAPSHGVAGFWISELYSPWKTLGEIVLDYLLKKDNPEELKVFLNTSSGELSREGEAPEWERPAQPAQSYLPGAVPAEEAVHHGGHGRPARPARGRGRRMGARQGVMVDRLRDPGGQADVARGMEETRGVQGGHLPATGRRADPDLAHVRGFRGRHDHEPHYQGSSRRPLRGGRHR
jgi:phage terminase large subunit GpA-like protein